MLLPKKGYRVSFSSFAQWRQRKESEYIGKSGVKELIASIFLTYFPALFVIFVVICLAVLM